ncbi:MAG: hypothetical protein QOF11_1558 [Chloroflexota bacterium]|jgi:uncharacterized membrane protein|nr:hypothetical protein [Chloroflexota bacterium]
MTQLLVIGFDTADEAREVLKSLRDLERRGQIAFEDTAVVSRDPDGKTHVHNEVSGTTETAAVVGGLIGVLVGSLLFPVVGLVLGATAGAAIGASLDTGVSASFIEEVKKQLQPGKSALFLVVREANLEAVTAALRSHRGKILQTTLDSELEAALRQALN